MNIFISWSGEKSKKVAELLSSWLPVLLQEIKPWISTRDIQSGSSWFLEINKKIAASSAGIICVTSDNLESRWLNFEAGALVKDLNTSCVIPYLIDIEPSDLGNPLNNLNAVTHKKDHFLKMILDLNSLLDKKITKDVIQKTFEKFWPDIEKVFSEIIESKKKSKKSSKKTNESSDNCENILHEIKEIKKHLSRIEGPSINPNNDYTLEKSKVSFIIETKEYPRVKIVTDRFHLFDIKASPEKEPGYLFVELVVAKAVVNSLLEQLESWNISKIDTVVRPF